MTKDNDPTRIQLFLGVLGFVGVILGILATIFAPIIQERLRQSNAASTQSQVVLASNTAPLPTDTVPVGADTSTPAPTDTPAPTFTFTAIPPVAIGQDWPTGCISTLWKPYPPTVPTLDKGNGCWGNPVHVFAASNGSLAFLASRDGNGTAEVFGLFAPLPESGEVTVKVSLKDLNNVDMWLGVFADADITSDGLLLTIPAGNPKKRLIVQKGVTNYETLQTTQMLDQGEGFSFTFRFTVNSVSGTVNPNVFVTNPAAMATPQKWFFIGYKGLSGSYRVEGSFFSLVLK